MSEYRLPQHNYTILGEARKGVAAERRRLIQSGLSPAVLRQIIGTAKVAARGFNTEDSDAVVPGAVKAFAEEIGIEDHSLISRIQWYTALLAAETRLKALHEMPLPHSPAARPLPRYSCGN